MGNIAIVSAARSGRDAANGVIPRFLLVSFQLQCLAPRDVGFSWQPCDSQPIIVAF